MKRILLALSFYAAGSVVVGCGDSSNPGGDSGSTVDMAVSTNPPPPTLGAQIDRMGRPGVNTALTDPFDIVTGMTQDQVKDAYNAEASESNWATKFSGYIATNLAILDGLDTVCGNQIGAATGSDGGMRYTALAGALADDELYVDTAQTSCGQYLAVEANALLSLGLKDCGGRTPIMDTIDVTYTALAVGPAGLTNPAMAVSDGISQPDPKPSTTAFPFLGAPL
jgi:hypothetical protein